MTVPRNLNISAVLTAEELNSLGTDGECHFLKSINISTVVSVQIQVIVTTPGHNPVNISGTCRAPEWHSGIRHCTSELEASLQTLGRLQDVSQPAVIGRPTGRRTIGPAVSGLGFCRGRPSM